jgi:hypothetical protein
MVVEQYYGIPRRRFGLVLGPAGKSLTAVALARQDGILSLSAPSKIPGRWNHSANLARSSARFSCCTSSR